jgi:hypothetical protein
MHSNYADIEAQPIFEHKLDASANAAAVINDSNVAAKRPDNFWVLDWVAWSYSGDPTGGKLTIALGGTTIFEVDITSGGPGLLNFDKNSLYDRNQTKNQTLTITLAAGGGSVVGKLQARFR